MAILNRLKLSHKLALILAVPVIVLIYFAWTQTSAALDLKQTTARLTELSELGVQASALVHELQKERGLTAGYLGSKGAEFASELAAQRRLTDGGIARLQGFLEQFDASRYERSLQDGLAQALDRLKRIAEVRKQVDGQTLALQDALAYYTGMNGKFLGLISELSKISPDEQLSIMTAAYAAFLQSKERAGIERAVLSNVFARDAFGPGLLDRFLALVTTQQNYRDMFLSLARPAQIRFYRDTMQGEFIDETGRMRQLARDRARDGGFETDPVYWFKMQTGKINLLKSVEDRLAADLKDAADRTAAGANRALTLALAVSVLGVGLAFALGYVLAHSIYRQLGGEPAYIADIADAIAQGNLHTELQDGGRRRTGIYASIVEMRDNLRRRIEHDRKAAAATQRIKTALDCVTTNVMVADAERNIIYANPAIVGMFRDAAADLRASIPGFDPEKLVGENIDRFDDDLARQRGLLDGVETTHESQVRIGPRTFRITANPVLDPDRNHLGTAVEWVDLTQELQAREEAAERLKQERRQAAETARIKSALDNVSSNVMMADTDGRIVYLNKAASDLFHAVQGDLRKDLPGFNADRLLGANFDDFHQDPNHQRNLLARLSSTHDVEVEIGGRTMRIVANPVTSDDGSRLGTAVEWADRTAEVAVEREVDAIVEAARDGDLSRRIRLDDKSGFFRQLGAGINDLIAVIDRAFGDIAEVMKHMARGDLTRGMENDYQGAFGEVKDDINATLGYLRDVVSKLRESADVIFTGASEISTGNSNLSARTEQQASSLEETASSMEELNATVRNNADNSRQANGLAADARRKAEQGGEVVTQAVQAMDAINTASSKIAEIIGVMDEIAFQTNLLALNASVEAARAGEQGRGFAVVATEVRNLAGRSATAAKEIKELIKDSGGKVELGAELVHKSGGTLEDIVTAVKKVGEIITDIAAASAEQAAGIDQVNQAVTAMDEVTQQNAALAEQTSAASASMSDKAEQLRELVARFQV